MVLSNKVPEGAETMIEIRFHGRGGQGSVIASRILAEAAFLEDKYASAFPYFGVERRGAPVTAFTRIDDKPIRNKSQIYEPHYVVVLDPVLVQAVNVANGLKKDGIVLINTARKSKDVELYNVKATTVDATSIAISHKLGSAAAPIVNSAILGAFSRVSKVVSIESIMTAIEQVAPAKKKENSAAAKEAYEKVNRNWTIRKK